MTWKRGLLLNCLVIILSSPPQLVDMPCHWSVQTPVVVHWWSSQLICRVMENLHIISLGGKPLVVSTTELQNRSPCASHATLLLIMKCPQVSIHSISCSRYAWGEGRSKRGRVLIGFHPYMKESLQWRDNLQIRIYITDIPVCKWVCPMVDAHCFLPGCCIDAISPEK